MNNLYRFVLFQNQLWGKRVRQSNFSAKPRPSFAYQWPENVEMSSKQNLIKNIACGSKVMSTNFHLLTMTGQTDARRRHVTVLHTSI